jgi:hypothetical protein
MLLEMTLFCAQRIADDCYSQYICQIPHLDTWNCTGINRRDSGRYRSSFLSPTSFQVSEDPSSRKVSKIITVK